jgi:hypothetical protein
MGIVIVKSWIWRGSKMNEDQYLYLLVKIKALEEENQELILLFLLSAFVFCLFMVYRNQWVYRKRKWFGEVVRKVTEEQVKKGTYDSERHLKYYDSIWDYNKMSNCFWVWDINKMVNDRELYQEVLDNSGPTT